MLDQNYPYKSICGGEIERKKSYINLKIHIKNHIILIATGIKIRVRSQKLLQWLSHILTGKYQKHKQETFCYSEILKLTH